MKTLSKDELQKLAEADFKTHAVSELHATTDGQIFIKESFARLHAGENGTVYTFTNVKTEAAPKPDSIPVLIAQLEGITSTDELNNLLKVELEGANRKGAIAAIHLRILNVSLETIEDKESLATLLEAEKSGPKRKEAIAAIEARIQKLNS